MFNYSPQNLDETYTEVMTDVRLYSVLVLRIINHLHDCTQKAEAIAVSTVMIN